MDFHPLAGIVFDLDGTLYRQEALRRAMMARLLWHGLRRPAAAGTVMRALRAYRHAQETLRTTESHEAISDMQLRLASQSSGLAVDVIEPIVARWMEREPLRLLERFVAPSLRELLSSAKSKGLRLGVFSDYPATAKLKAMNLSEFFDVVVSAQDAAVNRFKPHPSGLVETLRRLGVPASEAIYVGDRRDVDEPAARAARIRCVLVEPQTRARTQTQTQTQTRPGHVAPAEAVVSVPGYSELHAMLFAHGPSVGGPSAG